MLKLFVNANIIDGVNDAAISNGYLVVDSKEGVIVDVGQGNQEQWAGKIEPENVFDLNGSWVIPGLLDCHVHVMRDGSADPDSILRKDPVEMVTLRALRSAQRHLELGITTIRDNGSIGLSVLSVKRAINMGLFNGPNIIASGPPLIMTGGHFRTGGLEVDGVDEVLKAARNAFKNGADFIKVLATGGIYAVDEEPGSSQFTVEEMKAAVSVARKRNRKVVSHAQGREGIMNSLIAGVDTIEHACYADEECLEMFVKQGTYLVPTMKTMIVLAEGEELGIPRYAVEKAKEVVKVHFSMLKKAVKYGVKIATGTDSCSPGNPPDNYFEELKIMKEAGMSEMQVIQASTSVAADAMGLTNIVGRLAKGARADFVILDDSPLDSLDNLKKKKRVYKSGKEVITPIVYNG